MIYEKADIDHGGVRSHHNTDGGDIHADRG